MIQNLQISTPIKNNTSLSKDLNLISVDEYFSNGSMSPVPSASKDKSLSKKKICSRLLSSPPNHLKTNKNKPTILENVLDVSSESDFPKLNVTNSKCYKVASVNSTSNTKQKKRVAPITLSISTNKNEFSSPAFRAENNLIGIDYDDHLIARDLLKTHKDSIARSFLELNQTNRDVKPYEMCTEKKVNLEIDLINVSSINQLNKLVNIYSAIIDLNLTTNILSEISFLLNLLNADLKKISINSISEEKDDNQSDDITVSLSHIFKNINNCIYFSIGVLEKQKHILSMLDTNTLKILVENERILEFKKDLNEFLLHAYVKRTNPEPNPSPFFESVSLNTSSKLNVSYQQENDTKHNFPTIREFTAFNKQRDMFYNILR